MGPRFCKRGNALAMAQRLIAEGLQWGHAFVSVETDYERELMMDISMLQWGHAFVSVETGGM